MPYKKNLGSIADIRKKQRTGSSTGASSSADAWPPPPPPHKGKPETVGQVIGEMFLSNKLGGPDVARLARGALQSEAKDVERLAAVGGSGSNPKNLARDILRLLLKGSPIPPLFWHPIRVWDPIEQKQETVKMPFNLPHKVLSAMGPALTGKIIQDGMSPEYRQVFQEACAKLGLNASNTVSLGLHGDGVPFSKKDSIELLSFNFLGEPMGDRVPFAGISKMYACKCGCLGRDTFDDMLEVFVWSLRALLVQAHPSVDPAGKPLSDPQMIKVAGQPLGCPRAILVQVRGDWPFLKQLFSIPVWNNFCVCWRCFADKDANSYKDGSANAQWRKRRKQFDHFLVELRKKGIAVSPLFSAPGFEIFMIVLDWLHIVDLGIAQDLIGSLFAELIRGALCPGTKDQCLKALWGKLLQFYKTHKTPSRLDMLKEEMFERNGKAPKLKAKGGETRHLIPFAASVSAEVAQQTNDPYWHTIAAVFDRLFDCCKIIDGRPFDSAALATASRELCVLWTALEENAEQRNKKLWPKKPKVHLFQELCEYQAETLGTPELFWTYRDESWCGHMAVASKRRGGLKHAQTVPERLLERYRAMQIDGQKIAL